MKIPWHKRVYALYKGDVFIVDGTIREIAEETGKSIDFLRYMNSPVYKKRCINSKNRLAMVSLDDEEEL